MKNFVRKSTGKLRSIIFIRTERIELVQVHTMILGRWLASLLAENSILQEICLNHLIILKQGFSNANPCWKSANIQYSTHSYQKQINRSKLAPMLCLIEQLVTRLRMPPQLLNNTRDMHKIVAGKSMSFTRAW